MKKASRDIIQDQALLNPAWAENCINLMRRKVHGHFTWVAPHSPLERKMEHCLPRSMRSRSG